MTIRRRRPGARAIGMATITTTCLAMLSTIAPTAAAEPDEQDIDAYVQANDTPMGSQIARVEGVVDDVSDVADLDLGDPVDDAGLVPGEADDTVSSLTHGTVWGIDVSGWQREVDWNYWWNKGKRFAYVKATEGTSYQNPYFYQQYVGSYDRGFIRGAYHFARPNVSSGAVQANYFASNGGGWSPDGKTLPGVVDLEWNPYGSACYGKTKSQMRAWIRAFHDTYRSRTGRYPVVYTSTSWWNQCVGSGHGLENTSPLWIARYNSEVGALPPGWPYYTFWQYSSTPIDQNRFNGTMTQLRVLATARD